LNELQEKERLKKETESILSESFQSVGDCVSYKIVDINFKTKKIIVEIDFDEKEGQNTICVNY
jgi:hypothetical protein